MNNPIEELRQMIVNQPIEDRMIILQTVLQQLAQERGISWSGFLFELDAEYRKKCIELPETAQKLDERDRITWIQTQIIREDIDEQIETLRTLVDAAALSYGTNQRVILDKIDGRKLSEQEQDVKGTVIASTLRELDIDDTAEALRKAIEKLAARNRTTPATILGLIGTALHREWGNQYQRGTQRRKNDGEV